MKNDPSKKAKIILYKRGVIKIKGKYPRITVKAKAPKDIDKSVIYFLEITWS
jgi:hypothetical protein